MHMHPHKLVVPGNNFPIKPSQGSDNTSITAPLISHSALYMLCKYNLAVINVTLRVIKKDTIRILALFGENTWVVVGGLTSW